MTCRIEYDLNKYATKIINNDTGRTVHVPEKEQWEYIRFRIKQGDRLGVAYDKADVYNLLPSEDLIPCVKSVYYMTAIDPITRARVDKPFDDGQWILQAFCDCLTSSMPDQRINLGDGFIVPSPSEQSCIASSLINGVMSIYQAISSCCTDIMPPTIALDYIENALRSTNAPYYDIMSAARSAYVAGLLTPPASTPPPATTPPPSPISKNNLLLVGAVVAAILILK